MTSFEYSHDIDASRAKLDRFQPSDAQALAEILAEPDVTKNITADGSTPERCLASAKKRIGWHNAAWDAHGYGVWAVRSADAKIAPVGQLLGWCGFAEPDIGNDPEILYGLSPAVWGQGLATELAQKAIEWLFSETAHFGVSAIIFHRLNAASIAIVKKLGLQLKGTMALGDFYSSDALAKEVLSYELWRLAKGKNRDINTLLFEAPYRIGQLTTLGTTDAVACEAKVFDAARARSDYADMSDQMLKDRLKSAFQTGIQEPYLEWYHLSKCDR